MISGSKNPAATVQHAELQENYSVWLAASKCCDLVDDAVVQGWLWLALAPRTHHESIYSFADFVSTFAKIKSQKVDAKPN